MKGVLFGILIALLVGTNNVEAQASTGGMTIQQATDFCESAVPQYCVSTTCPLFCQSIRHRRQRETCSTECTETGRCVLLPVAGSSNGASNNRILEAQNRDQLFACIAEKRDPSGSVTGRRMTSWQQLRSPSFKKATRIY